MRPVARYRKQDLACVHVLTFPGPDGRDRLVEVVESVQPPIPRTRKWVVIVSTLFGCPVGCAICDAGDHWTGRLSAEQILDQIDHVVLPRHPDRRLPQEKWKVQFARMGEPTLNPAVLEVLRILPSRYDAPGLIPSISTIAPASCGAFLEELLEIKEARFPGGRFQLQFSLHTTDARARRQLIPARTWDLPAIARYGERFAGPDDRKVTLNFAACRGLPVEADRLGDVFDPERFLIKLTPLNPTRRARETGLRSWIDPERPETADDLAGELAGAGFEVLVSIGEVEENAIGSNCGQFVSEMAGGRAAVREGYGSERYAVSVGEGSEPRSRPSPRP